MGSAEVLAELQAKVGQQTHVSEWETVTQEMIDQFANATGDHQWIHVDPERARQESPYGRTIAHGYFTLSLYPRLRGLVDESTPIAPGVKQVINYGLNKLRFPNAVKVGSKIRAVCTLTSVEPVKDSLQITEQYAVEIKDQERPACVAECVMRLYF